MRAWPVAAVIKQAFEHTFASSSIQVLRSGSKLSCQLVLLETTLLQTKQIGLEDLTGNETVASHSPEGID